METKTEIQVPNDSRKSLVIFWSRMLGWITTQCVLPIGIFSWKFGLFNKASYGTQYDELGNVVKTSISLNGWGIVSIFLVGWTVIQILNQVLDSMEGYSLTKQTIDGIKSRVIPLVIIFFICYFLNGVLAEIMYCLGTLIVSQLVSIPLNPLPQWVYKKKGVEDYRDALTTLVEYVKTKKK